MRILYKKFVLSFLALTLIFLLPLQAYAKFQDVPKENPYYEAVKYLETLEIIEGGKKKIFRPEKAVSRETFVLWASKWAKIEPDKSPRKVFSDVPQYSELGKYVSKLARIGLLPSQKIFSPGVPATRAFALQLLFDVKGIAIPKFIPDLGALPYKDLLPNTPQIPLANIAKKFGLIEKESIKLQKSVTRGEAARFMQKIDQSGGVTTDGVAPSVTIEILPAQIESSESDSKLLNHPKFGILLDAWKQIHEKHINKDALDDKKLIYGAVKGMVKALDDPYSTFAEPEESKTIAIENEFDGVGIIIEMIDEKVKVVSPLKDTPAEKAGIISGDVIVKVDEKETKGLAIDQVANMIRGKAGTQVKLTIERDGKSLEFTLVREKITITSVRYTMIENGKIAYIEIVHFSQDVDAAFSDALKEIFPKKPKGFIVDLRNNPGGFLDASLRVLEHVVPKGKIMSSVQFSDGTQNVFTSNGLGEVSQYPLAVLVNKGSASASEIVAGAIKDHALGTLIGEQTFGKGTVQELISYIDGSVLKLTIAKWLTPAGTNLVKEGIKPHIEVARTDEDRKANKDPQKDRAVEELLKKM